MSECSMLEDAFHEGLGDMITDGAFASLMTAIMRASVAVSGGCLAIHVTADNDDEPGYALSAGPWQMLLLCPASNDEPILLARIGAEMATADRAAIVDVRIEGQENTIRYTRQRLARALAEALRFIPHNPAAVALARKAML